MGVEVSYLGMASWMHRVTEPAIRSAIRALQLLPGSRGLDAGCGIGTHTLWLAETTSPEGHVTGIDISPECLARAEETASKSGLAVNALTGSFQMLWGKAEPEVTPEDWAEFQRLCRPESPDPVLNLPDYYAFITYSLFRGKVAK